MSKEKQIQAIKSKIESSGGSLPKKSGKEPSTSLYARFMKSYSENTPPFCKLLDAFLVCTVYSGVIQFVYMLVMGTFPYNAFLSGFATSCGMFCNIANLRIQLHPKNSNQVSISYERAYADFAFSSMVLFLFAVSFIG